MKKHLVFRVEKEDDAREVLNFFENLKGKTVKITDASASGISRSIKTIMLRVEVVEDKDVNP